MSTPSRYTSPEVTGMSWVMRRPSVDLPQPDSPTRPTVSPGKTSKLTPSTALTDAPTPAPKCFTTLTTRRSGSTDGVTRGAGATTVSVTDRLRDGGGHLDRRERTAGWMDTTCWPPARVGVGARGPVRVGALP